MGQNIFQNPTKAMPKNDPQIIRVDMDQMDLGGRRSHLPSKSPNADGNLSVQHVKASVKS